MASNAKARYRVTRADFLTSAPGVEGCPSGEAHEFAAIGRSNVGKSSLLNALSGVGGLARVSRQPGRTRLLNFFELELARGKSTRVLRWVDLPGYGFAKARRAVRDELGPMIRTYLRAPERPLRAVLLLLDARRGLGPLDEQMLELCAEAQRDVLVCLTKTDKLSRSELGLVRRKTGEALGVDGRDLVSCSSQTGEGLFDREGLASVLWRLSSPPHGDA